MKIITAVLATACVLLTGCGAAVTPQDDGFRKECIDNGGTYTDFETDGDTCTYNTDSP